MKHENLYRLYLTCQSRMIPGFVQAALFVGAAGSWESGQILKWPGKEKAVTALVPVVKTALTNRRAVVKTRGGQNEKAGEPLDVLAYPLIIRGQPLGVLAVEMTQRSQALQREAVQQVKTGVQWLEGMLTLQGDAAKDQLVTLVELMAAALDAEQFESAAWQVTREIANRFDCSRVSLGLVRGLEMRVVALSHTRSTERRSNVILAIEKAMTEALDQGQSIVFPPLSDHPEFALPTHFNARLARDEKRKAVCTVPMVMKGKAIGALVLEREIDEPFDVETLANLERVSLLLGPVMETRRKSERSLFSMMVESTRKWFADLIGLRRLKAKLMVFLVAFLLVFLCFARGMLNVSCDAVLEAAACRAVVAPQEGFIAEARVRAGDYVHEGELLATLDDRELLLEKNKWQSQRAQLLKAYRKALAVSDRTEIAILKAKLKQAAAQLELIEQRLSRSKLIAPFDGLIVKGDLSQSLGSPVTPGDVLYEVAPRDDYRVVLKVDDRDMRMVKLGQPARLKLSGIPDQVIPIAVERVTPVATSENGRNYFRVEAVMHTPSDLMRPGMEGVAKIEIGKETLLKIWTRRLSAWLNLSIWSLTP